MECSFHCEKTKSCCDNHEVKLVCSWTKELLAALQSVPAINTEAAIKRCHQAHYEALNMDAVLEPFIGNPEAFYRFLQEQWNWIVKVDATGKHILADENKAECVCPLVKAAAINSPNLCKCSEGFTEHIFTTVLQQSVTARVQESVLRGGTHCVYEIIVD